MTKLVNSNTSRRTYLATLLILLSPCSHSYSGSEYFEYIEQHNNGEPLSAECIQFHWRSSDNIEEYQEQLGIEDDQLGYSIGQFINKDNVGILSRTLDECSKRTDARFKKSKYVFNNKKYITSEMYFGDLAYPVDYMVAKEFDANYCAARLNLKVELLSCWLFDIRPYRSRSLSLIAVDEFNRFIPIEFKGDPSDYGFASWKEMQP